MSSCLVRVLASLVVDRTIEKLTLCLVDLLITAAVQHYEVVLPAIRHLKVFLGSWESFGHALLDRGTRLLHHFL